MASKLTARELHCEDCDHDYTVWYADNDLWNAVMRCEGSAYANDQPEPFLRARCFLLRAEKVTDVARITWPETRSPPPARTKTMTGELVERLRRSAEWRHKHKVGAAHGHVTADDMDEAASEIVRLREALERAERWFRDYERQHRAKGTLDGNLKADTNEERADYLRSALSPSVSDGGE